MSLTIDQNRLNDWIDRFTKDHFRPPSIEECAQHFAEWNKSYIDLCRSRLMEKKLILPIEDYLIPAWMKIAINNHMFEEILRAKFIQKIQELKNETRGQNAID